MAIKDQDRIRTTQAQGKFNPGVIQPQGLIVNNTDTQHFNFNNIQNEINEIEKYNKANETPKSYLPEGEESSI
ncbi:hypothetical protein B2I21_15175 [Chryseobacterium mucoviscidosis]|nr:hypothetical protein B2I21_15175 [Chryseobacterium mucoviscidosis]